MFQNDVKRITATYCVSTGPPNKYGVPSFSIFLDAQLKGKVRAFNLDFTDRSKMMAMIAMIAMIAMVAAITVMVTVHAMVAVITVMVTVRAITTRIRPMTAVWQHLKVFSTDRIFGPC